MVADVLGSDTVVVQSVAAWSERYREDIQDAISKETGISNVSYLGVLVER